MDEILTNLTGAVASRTNQTELFTKETFYVLVIIILRSDILLSLGVRLYK